MIKSYVDICKEIAASSTDIDALQRMKNYARNVRETLTDSQFDFIMDYIADFIKEETERQEQLALKNKYKKESE